MKSKVIITIVIIISIMVTATAFTAVAEEYEYVPSYTVEMGTITAVHSTLNKYNQIVIGTIEISTETMKIFRISKDNQGYILDGVRYSSEHEIEEKLRGYTMVSISGYYKDVYYFKKQINVSDTQGLYMYNTLVTATPLNSTQIPGVAYAVNETQISKLTDYTIRSVQKYVPNPEWNKLVTTVSRYGAYLQRNDTIYYYEADTNAYNQGYKEGYAKATNTVNKDSASYQQGLQDSNAYDYTFYGLMSSVINAPVQAFSGMFDITILGTNLRAFLLALLTISIVILIIRKFTT